MNESKIRSDELEESSAELDLEASEGDDLEAVVRDAVAAVEQVEERGAERRGGGGLEEEVLRLRQEVREVRERSVRTLADFENYRKRSVRERQDLQRYALMESTREMLAVVDNFERALSSAGSVEDLRQGVELILRQLMDVLKRQGVEEIPAEGEPFDPSVHEAVSKREDPAVLDPVVVQEMQKGYKLHDRLLRPAIVEVAVPVETKD